MQCSRVGAWLLAQQLVRYACAWNNYVARRTEELPVLLSLRPSCPAGKAQGSLGQAGALVTGASRDSLQLGLDDFLHVPHPFQLWEDVPFFDLVENLVAIEIHFKAAIGPRSERNRYITTKGTEEFVRHPRGGRVMFSSDAIHDVDERFPFISHSCPPLSGCIRSVHLHNNYQPCDHSTHSGPEVKRASFHFGGAPDVDTLTPAMYYVATIPQGHACLAVLIYTCGWPLSSPAVHTGDVYEQYSKLASEVCGDGGFREAVRGGPSIDQGQCSPHSAPCLQYGG
jgi:hypothetical protein